MFETPKAWSEMRDAFKADDSLSDFVPRMCSKMLFLEISIFTVRASYCFTNGATFGQDHQNDSRWRRLALFLWKFQEYVSSVWMCSCQSCEIVSRCELAYFSRKQKHTTTRWLKTIFSKNDVCFVLCVLLSTRFMHFFRLKSSFESSFVFS